MTTGNTGGITPILIYENITGGSGGGFSYRLEVFEFERTTNFPSGFTQALPHLPQGDVILEMEGYAMSPGPDYTVSGSTVSILKTETDIAQYEDAKLRFRATYLRQI